MKGQNYRCERAYVFISTYKDAYEGGGGYFVHSDLHIAAVVLNTPQHEHTVVLF